MCSSDLLGAEILPETKAEKISYSEEIYQVETRRITSFFGRHIRTFKSRNIVFAGGTLGTLELLLKQKYKYNTLPLLSEKLGFELRTNAETLCAVSGAAEKLNNGLAITSVFSPDHLTHVEIVKYPDKSNVMKWFFGLSVPGARSSLHRTWMLLVKSVTHPLKFFKTLFNFRWSTKMVIFLVMQTTDNAMKMVWKNGFAGGRMKIDNKGNRRVPAYIAVGQEVMERYAEKVKGISQNILLEVIFNRPTTAHILGGCPMSENTDNGVVDKYLRVHGYPGMYITDGSVVQGNIGVNPSFTITAMAEYCMSNIPARQESEISELSKQLILLEEEWKKRKLI